MPPENCLTFWGRFNEAKVNVGQQNKHIPYTNEYKASIANGNKRSTVNGNLADIQKLLNEKAGTGEMIGGNKERVDFGQVIGQYVDPVTGQGTDTSMGIIHYGNKGAYCTGKTWSLKMIYG